MPLMRADGAGAAHGHPLLRVADEFVALTFETFEIFN